MLKYRIFLDYCLDERCVSVKVCYWLNDEVADMNGKRGAQYIGNNTNYRIFRMIQKAD